MSMVGLALVLILRFCIIAAGADVSVLILVLIVSGWMVIGCLVLFAIVVFFLRGDRILLIECKNCGKKIRRGRRYSEFHDCFCSCRCHTIFMNLQRRSG